jgi:NAD(P)-dependent dehydrogenase (short-subunit alcohol dehydrogenase family)
MEGQGRSDLKRFQGKTVVVTGAASGIGRAAARRFGAEGASVFCIDRNEEGLTATVTDIGDAGGLALAAACDISDPTSVTTTIALAVEHHGGIDVLANVAGIGGFRRTMEVTIEEWNRVIAVNLTGTFLMCQAALPHILKAKGAIINTASVAGMKSHPYSAAYCASKGGVVMLTKALAAEYGRKDVRINCVCPGGIDTPMLAQFKLPQGVNEAVLMRMMPLGRHGMAEEVAGTMAFLASSDASYMNGTILVVDGGMTA